MVHGNVHPGTVLIADDGRVVLADARADRRRHAPRPTCGRSAASSTSRSPATGRTPRPARLRLPDAVRDGGGAIAAPAAGPRRRPGLPRRPDHGPARPPARAARGDVLAAELGRLDVAADEPVPRRRGRAAAVQHRRTRSLDEPQPGAPGRKVAVGVAGLLAVAIGRPAARASARCPTTTTAPTARPTVGAGVSAPASPGGASSRPRRSPRRCSSSADQVRIVDPRRRPHRARRAPRRSSTATATRLGERQLLQPALRRPQAGHGHPDRPRPSRARSPRCGSTLTGTGAIGRAADGQGDDPAPSAGDEKLVRDIQEPDRRARSTSTTATTLTFGGFPPDEKYQYLLVWFTELPTTTRRQARLEQSESAVRGRRARSSRRSTGLERSAGAAVTPTSAAADATTSCCAPTSTATRTRSPSCSAATATGSGRSRCARSATARTPPTPCRTRCSRRTAPRPGSAATRPSPPGCTASSSTPASTGIRRRQAHPTVPLPDGRPGRDPDRPAGVEPAAPVDRPRHRAGRPAGARQLPVEQRAALVLVDLQGYPVAEVAADPRCGRGHGQEPVRAGPGPAGGAARPPRGRIRACARHAANHRTGDPSHLRNDPATTRREGVS